MKNHIVCITESVTRLVQVSGETQAEALKNAEKLYVSSIKGEMCLEKPVVHFDIMASKHSLKRGRPKATEEDIPAIFHKHLPLYLDGKLTVSDFARVCKLSRPSIYKYLKMLGKDKH